MRKIVVSVMIAVALTSCGGGQKEEVPAIDSAKVLIADSVAAKADTAKAVDTVKAVVAVEKKK